MIFINLPNIITMFRFILAFVFIYSFLNWGNTISIMIFLIAGISDILDGYLARKYNLITDLGKALDPLADKIMSISVIIALYLRRLIPIWLVGAIVIKEVLMIKGAFYLYMRKEKLIIPSNKYGKMATIAFYIIIFLILFMPEYNYILSILLIFIILIAFLSYFKIFYNKIRTSEYLKK